MYMIEIAALDNGAHRNQSYPGAVPDGWALVREDVSTLENFPFGEVIAEEIDGVMTMTQWIPGELPEPEPEPEPAPTQLDMIEAQVTYTAMMTDTLIMEV